MNADWLALQEVENSNVYIFTCCVYYLEYGAYGTDRFKGLNHTKYLS